jgi:hypothetical protein
MRNVLAVVALAAGCARGASSTPPSGAPETRARLAQLQACDKDDDCVQTGDHCNYGCGIAVNKARAVDASELFARGRGTPCNMDCPPYSGVACQRGSCASVERAAADSGSASE